MLIGCGIAWSLLAGVFAIPPGHPRLNLAQPGIVRSRTGRLRAAGTGHHDFPDDALVAVALGPDHIDLPPEDQSREALFGALAECLLLFRRIDARKPDLELLVMGVKHGEGVAVTDADDFACEGGCGGLAEGKKRNTTQSDPEESSRHLRINAVGSGCL